MSVTWTGGTEHWTRKGDIKLFLWRKKASPNVPHAGTIFFVHGSSMASQPTFDLQVPGDQRSVMQSLNARGYSAFALDMRGYGKTPRDATGWRYFDASGKSLLLTCVMTRSPREPIMQRMADLALAGAMPDSSSGAIRLPIPVQYGWIACRAVTTPRQTARINKTEKTPTTT